MKRRNNPIKLFLLDTKARIEALEQSFQAEGIKDLSITAYDENGVSKTPLPRTDFSARLPREFDIYMLHLPLTTERAISDLRRNKHSTFIWLNNEVRPWSLPEEFRQNLTGYYDSTEPTHSARKVTSVWQESQR